MQRPDILTLLPKELDRLTVIGRFKAGDITQIEAARVLSLSERHLRRLMRRYEAHGPQGVVNRRVGKKASNRISEELRAKCLALIHQHFYDYGPTLASEKLQEYFQIKVSKETVRRWMVDEQIWDAKRKRAQRPHPPRARRPMLGELVQVDGSYHRWFEERGPKCCLLVFIDDATGRLMKLQFSYGETTIDYMDAFKDYVLTHGAPRALYFDKHNVFHINQRSAKAQNGLTQFGRVLKTLHISPIYAHSPQAKGRVERANETLQDRLIKELRFYNISDMESGNAFLKGFIERFNKQFERKALENRDLHRILTSNEMEKLDYIFSIHSSKKISKDLLVRHNKEVFKVIPPKNRTRSTIYQKAILTEDKEGMKIYVHGKPIAFTVLKRCPLPGPTLNRKTLDHYLDQQQKLNHYWKIAL